MATVIQEQPAPSFGAALGSGLGQGIGNQLMLELKKQQEQEKMKKFSAFVQAMQQAPDREGAFTVLSGAMSSGMFEDPHDVNAGFHLLDMIHPLKDQTPHEVTLFDQQGNPQKRYLPASQLGGMSDPNFVQGHFPGLSAENPGPKKPYIYPEGTAEAVDPSGFDFQLSKTPQFAGNFTEQNAPAGAQPEDAYKLGLEFARGKRQELTAERQTRAQELRATAEDRRAQTAASQEKNRGADNLRQDLNSADRSLKTYYGKSLPDGSFSFDDEDKRKGYAKALEKAKDHIRQGDDYATAVVKSIHETGVIKDVPPPPPANAKPEEKQGWLSNLLDKLTGKGGKKEQKLSPEQAQMKQSVEKAGLKFEPDKYEYKIVGNQILRRPKGNAR